MSIRRRLVATLVALVAFPLVVAAPQGAVAAEPAAAQKPVRMGCGKMTFDTVPGWGLGEDGKSQIGSTHGGVAVGKDGTIWTSSSLGIFGFSPDGKVVRRFLGDAYSNIHDLKIYPEGEGEYLYGARNVAGEGIKIHPVTGEVVLKLGIPKESGLGLEKWAPTAITVTPDGDIFLADGYASNHVFRFDNSGKYLKHFGVAGNGMKELNTAHGMTLDPRYDPPRLLVCDRNHQPKGRLVHYDLDGNFIEEVVTGLGMPTSAIVQGDFVAIPDLHGRLVILDKSNTIMAVLGHNSDGETRVNHNVPQEKWIEGIFNGTHGSAWDAAGNLYIQDWNVSGRIMKLVRVE